LSIVPHLSYFLFPFFSFSFRTSLSIPLIFLFYLSHVLAFPHSLPPSWVDFTNVFRARFCGVFHTNVFFLVMFCFTREKRARKMLVKSTPRRNVRVMIRINPVLSDKKNHCDDHYLISGQYAVTLIKVILRLI